MSTIHTRTHVGTDGILRLQVPVDVANADVDVTVVVEPAQVRGPMSPEEWDRFIESTAGKWEGEPLARPDQGNFETRGEWG